MKFAFSKHPVALAAVAAIGVSALTVAPTLATAAGKTAGKYVAGDFHNHTTCSDGALSMQKLVKKSTGTESGTWGLDWFVQAGHGGNGNRNCTLVEDDSLATPAYPTVRDASGAVMGPNTLWQNSNPVVNPKGRVTSPNGSNGVPLPVPPNQNMWRWQALQEFQYPLLEYLAANKNVPLFLGVESVVAGHEHASMSVITGQMPMAIDTVNTNVAKYSPLGNANALAQWEYCFDRNDSDTSRGNATVGTVPVAGGNNWNCAVTGSDYSDTTKFNWNTTAQKLIPTGGTGTGERGHLKTLEAVKWMKENHPQGSYYVPAHLERAGPFNPNGNNGFNIEHLRNLNNAAPAIAFGFETQPGHGASSDRGEYLPRRNNIGGVLTDSVGGTTYGGTGVYGAQIGGVWDALLGEGRNFWFFASSDWHNRGSFGPDDRRSTQDFQPGEYQRNYTLVRNGGDKLRPQTIVDGLRSGNNFAASGQLIDRLAFVACASYKGIGARTDASVEALALSAAQGNTTPEAAGCASMGEKLVVRPGADIVVAVVLRDPEGESNSPYTFDNPSLKQVGISQPLNKPVLSHVDVIGGLVTGYKTPGAADYAGQWPANTAWLRADGSTAGLDAVPAAAKNTSAAILKTFGGSTFTKLAGGFIKMSFRIPAAKASQYLRLRGSNLPASVPFETDANGNPLADLFTNDGNGTTDRANLRIPCTTVGTTDFNGCPAHLPVVNGQKMVAYDIAAWSDLWFYSNPIYVEVTGGTVVAGVK